MVQEVKKVQERDERTTTSFAPHHDLVGLASSFNPLLWLPSTDNGAREASETVAAQPSETACDFQAIPTLSTLPPFPAPCRASSRASTVPTDLEHLH